jgi:hypothetical protein
MCGPSAHCPWHGKNTIQRGFLCPELCRNCARIRELLTKSKKYRIIGIGIIPCGVRIYGVILCKI